MAKKSKARKEEEEEEEEEEEYSDVSYDEEEDDEDDDDESEYDESDDEPRERGGGAGGRKKISQLAFAVGKDVDNPKGKRKEMRRLRQFLGFAGRSVLLTLDDLPEDFAPRTAKKPTAFVLNLRSVESWPIPSALTKRLQEYPSHSLKYSVAMSFYHSASKRFFGSTWMGFKQSPPKKSDVLLVNEVVYWNSSIVDPNCFAVLELVATEVDDSSGVVMGQYGCGWSMLQPFGDTGVKDISLENKLGEEGYQPLKVYSGTPRKLRFLTKEDFYRLDEISVSGCRVRYRLNTHERLAKMLKSAPLFEENELVGAADPIGGLEMSKVKFPDERGIIKGPILGGEAFGSKKNWQMTPSLRPGLAPNFTMTLKKLAVTIPDRDNFERQLLSSLNENVPEEEVYKEESNMFGRKKMMKQTVAENTKAKAKILQRRLKIGLHNGHSLLSNMEWTEVEVEESDHDDDVLMDFASKQILAGFPKSSLTAVVVVLEYVIRPAKSSVKSHAETGRKGKNSTAENFIVVVGSQVYVPYDGKRLRLRNESKSRDKEPNVVKLSLFNDQRCRLFSNDHVYNPNEDDLEDEEDGVKTISFELTCKDKKGKEQRDETPLRDADESEDEAEVDDVESDAETFISDAESVSTKFSSSEEEEEEEEEEDDDESPRKKTKKKKKKRKKKKKKKKTFDDDDSDLESSIVSGDSFSNFLVLRTGAGRRSYSNFRGKRSQKGKHRYSADDAALTSIKEEEWEGWRQGIHVPKDRKNLSGAALTAPMHFHDDGYERMHSHPTYARTGDYDATALAPGSSAPLSSGMTRAARTRLGRHGFFEKVLENYTDVNEIDEGTFSVDKELEDEKLRHEITVQFAAFSAVEKKSPLPTSLYFTFQFYDAAPTRTERLVLRKSSRSDDDDHTIARVLCREKPGKRESEYKPSRTLKFTFDLSMMTVSEAKSFASYLKTKTLYVDVWDGDALMHVGTMAINLKKLMRQGKSTSKVARVFDVVAPRGLSQEGGALGVRPGAIGGGAVVGKVQVLLANFGEEGKGGEEPGAGVEVEAVESNGRSEDLNWRSNVLSKSLTAVARPTTPGGRAKHKVRARPLSESNKDLKRMVKSFGVTNGDLGKGRLSRGSEDNETISYEELMNLCKRFRSSQKGRIDYKNSGLLELLDVPDVARLEKRLVRLLTLAEDRGTSLEETFNFLDSDNDKEMTAQELEDGLKSLKAFEGMRRDEISILVSRFPRNADGMVSLNEFIAFVRDRQPKSPEEDKLRKILKKAEAMGKSVEDIFGFFDKDGNGEITLAEFRDGMSQLGSFSKLSNKEFKALSKKFDSNGDGKVSLYEFMTFMGKQYDPVDSATKKLKLILLKAEEMGTSLSKAFAEFDSDGSGEITIAEFSEGLNNLGVFNDLDQKQVAEVLKHFDSNNTGTVSLTEFMRFVGRDYVADIESKLRKILAKAVDMGSTIEACFAHFDTDADGKINAADMQTGMKSLGQFEQVGASEAQELIRRFDDDGDGCITEGEFISAFGSKLASTTEKGKGVSATQKKVVELFIKAEEKGATLKALFQALGGDKPELTQEEFGSSLRKLGAGFDTISSEELADLCKEFDADSSGAIDLKEFKTFIRSKQAEIKAEAKRDALKAEESVQTAEDIICAIYGVCLHFSGGQKLSDFSNGRESISFSGWYKALGAMLSDPKLVKPLEAQFNSETFQNILRQDFRDPSAQNDGEISVELFEQWCEARSAGARNMDKQLKNEVAMLARLVIANSLELQERDEVSLEHALQVLSGAGVRIRGKGVGKLFPTYAKKGVGGLATSSLVDLLVRLTVNCKIKATEGELKSLVKRMDRGGGSEVDVVAFFDWLCKGAKAGEEEGKEEDDDNDDEVAGNDKENEAEDDDAEVPYNFSTDPEIRDVEKKIRRASRRVVSGGGVDLTDLFSRYDGEGSGTIVRSDFIQILMEIGLSLLDSAGGGSGEVDEVRKRQMATLASYKGNSGKRAAKLRSKRPQLFNQRAEDRSDAFNDEREALNLIKWYREGQKKTVVRDLLAQSLTTRWTLNPRFGHSLFFEYELKNPFGQEERFEIQFDDKELRLVTDSEEWMYLRRRVPVAVGKVGEWPVEHDMFDGDSSTGFQVTLQPHETISVPFALLSIDHTLKGDEGGERLSVVNFVSSSFGHTTSVLELKIRPKAMIVDRSFRFFQAEGEILKRTIQLLGEPTSLDYHDYESEGVGSHKYVHCVELTNNRVVVDWRGSAQPGSPQEILIKYRVGKFPSVGEFYVLIYDDHFQGVVHECWHVVVQSRLRLDVHAAVGQSTPAELVIQGDKYGRRVALYSSSPAEATFDPGRPFQLVPGAFNRASVKFKMRTAGSHKLHLHMVDLDTKELVCAWLASVTSDLPSITKVYDVSLPAGVPSSKKLSFSNQWDRARRYRILSSDESVMRPRNETVDIGPRAVGFIRLQFMPIDRVGTTEVVAFVNSEEDQNEEAFLLKLHVAG